MNDNVGPRCPVPARDDAATISLAHGEGGRLMRELLRADILPPLTNEFLARQGDAAVLPQLDGPPVFTTDSFVVAPLFFPGGDIGALAVHGTVNDLAVAGARPRWLSLGLILEEGFPRADLARVLASAASAARDAGVLIVTGDTKVVPRGAADGLFINTAGVGELVFPTPGPPSLSVGDELLISGPVGRHGMAVLAEREKLSFDPPLQTDSASLFPAVEALRQAGIPVKALRDATRGGVAAVLHEWAAACGHTLAVDAQQVPVTPGVRGACELLGLDPLHVASEGTMVIAVPAGVSASVLRALHDVPVAAGAARIGDVQSQRLAPVVVSRALRRLVPLDEPLGAPLPRIC
jgi:hydrogenase expression/formation protein HypE